MDTRQLGTSDLSITPIGFGAWAIGGSGWEFAWGTQDDKDSIAAIREALDAGINWIDTAAVYGLGHSEEIVARALEGVRERPYVFTKCSMVWDEHLIQALGGGWTAADLPSSADVTKRDYSCAHLGLLVPRPAVRRRPHVWHESLRANSGCWSGRAQP
jgi:aryl-alcohol dehydrogenase-like predicted oxidoreductase